MIIDIIYKKLHDHQKMIEAEIHSKMTRFENQIVERQTELDSLQDFDLTEHILNDKDFSQIHDVHRRVGNLELEIEWVRNCLRPFHAELREVPEWYNATRITLRNLVGSMYQLKTFFLASHADGKAISPSQKGTYFSSQNRIRELFRDCPQHEGKPIVTEKNIDDLFDEINQIEQLPQDILEIAQ